MRANTNEKQISVAENVSPTENKYYRRISRIYLILTFLFLVLFLVFVASAFAVFGKDITYSNFKYLLKDFSSDQIVKDTDFENLAFNARTDSGFCYYKGGLALINNDSFRYFDSSGNILIEEKLTFTSPAYATSDKYIIVYDIGGTEYRIYNQLTSVLIGKSDDAIVSADVADDGSYLIVTRSRKTKYAAELYSPTFEKVMTVNKDTYVIDSVLARDGKTFGILSIVYSGNDASAEIVICRRGQDTPVFQDTYPGNMPYFICETGENFSVLCDKMLLFLDMDGNAVSRTDLMNQEIGLADRSDSSVVIVCPEDQLGNINRILVFDAAGNKLHDGKVNARISKVFASEYTGNAMAFYIVHDRLYAVSPSGNTIEFDTDSHMIDIIPLENNVLVCYESNLKVFSLED